MLKTRSLPKVIACKNFKQIKLSLKKDDLKLQELLDVYMANREHLSFWHHNWEELSFNTIGEIKKHLVKNRLTCYVIQYSDKIIGCIEIGRLSDDDNEKSRILTYWIDKNYTRKGIMFNALSAIENMFIKQKLDYLRVEIDTENEPSIKLAGKLNYKIFSSSWMVSENGKTMLHFYTFWKKLGEES